MKQFNLKKLLTVAFLGAASITNAQSVHPFSFGFIGTATTSNWYVDYVGTRFAVTTPASVAGDKLYSKAEVASGWTNMSYASLPLINVPVAMGPAGDTDGCLNFTAASMTGKIALIWRGTCEFGFKANNAQNAGAVAVVIVNNQPGGLPVGMGAGSVGAGVTIPTFMISNADGQALSAAYAGGAGTVKMTITPWGEGLGNDLGFIPQGTSNWMNFATPANQVVSSGNPDAMKAIDGAFIANYGTNPATNVSLSSSVTYTPTGGSATSIHTASISVASIDNSNAATDSVWALFMPSYNLSGITGNGRVNIKYTIASDSTDANPANDTFSTGFYLTDSLYSKGRYDFTTNKVLAGTYSAANVTAGDVFYLWGNTYYVNKSGSAADRVQWSMSSNTDTAGEIQSLSTVNVYLFKWVEGMNGQPIDSFIENGELELIGLGIRDFSTTTPADTSGGQFLAYIKDSNGTGGQPFLPGGSWYYVAVELPGETGTTWFMGCDGFNNTYPRSYGRWQNNFVEYASPVWVAGRYAGNNAQVNTFSSAMSVSPFGGNFDVDSVLFDSQKGLIPSVPLWVNNHPNKIENVTQSFATFELFPNPATDKINVNIDLDNTAKAVTYTVLSAQGRVVGKETHNNVKNEKFSYNTSNLATGNYFMVVVADGKQMFKKFTVLR